MNQANLTENRVNVLKFMASNGLVANPKKTTLIFLNQGKVEEEEITM